VVYWSVAFFRMPLLTLLIFVKFRAARWVIFPLLHYKLCCSYC